MSTNLGTVDFEHITADIAPAKALGAFTGGQPQGMGKVGITKHAH
jgi:hypothetical protein